MKKQVQKSSLGKVPAGISSNVASGEVNEFMSRLFVRQTEEE